MRSSDRNLALALALAEEHPNAGADAQYFVALKVTVTCAVLWPRLWMPRDICQCHGDVRILSIGYQSFMSTWTGETPTVYERSRQFLDKLSAAGVGGQTAL